MLGKHGFLLILCICPRYFMSKIVDVAGSIDLSSVLGVVFYGLFKIESEFVCTCTVALWGPVSVSKYLPVKEINRQRKMHTYQQDYKNEAYAQVVPTEVVRSICMRGSLIP